MRLIALLVWILVFGAADVLVMARQKPAPTPLIATRAMDPNHLLGPTDVALGTAGGYVSRHIDKGQPIVDLVEAPTLKPAASDAVIIALPVERSFVVDGSINEGTQLYLCHAAAPVGPPMSFPARTVICPATGACSVLVEVPVAQAPLLANSPTPRSRPCG